MSKQLPSITEEEKHFDLPQGWEWCRLGSTCELVLGKMLDQRKNKGELKPYLRNFNVNWFGFNLVDVLEMRFTEDETERFSISNGDIVICEGGYPGTAAIWESEDSIYFQKALHRARFYFPHTNKYLLYFLFLSFHNGVLQNYYTGAGIQHLTGKSLSMIPFPLPPLAEQQRIVEKVDRLMALCDELEKEVSNAKKYASQLMEAVLQEVLNGKAEAQKDNIIQFAAATQPNKDILLAAARGNMREDTWQRIANEAIKLAYEES